MDSMDRREFLCSASRWAAALGFVFFAGNLVSCTRGESETQTTDDGTAGEEVETSVPQVDTNEQAGTSSKTVAVVTSKCTGCGKCTQGICPEDAIHLQRGAAVVGPGCRGCGDCFRVCPRNAIVLSETPASSYGTGSAAAPAIAGAGGMPVRYSLN
ncbi:MAG: hypothetical protein C4536_09350 [Actinobacteria bacterium]|jgi:ferredoxin|nr:MAG: hypothetical protein C4536_09350 [Actinomycetota bacterium]